jgi:tripartite-type tricarboxylate transporter receptor subunit TctC
MHRLRHRITQLCLVAAIATLAGAAAAAEPSFAGKTVRLVVNQLAGGPTDIFARHFVRFWEAHLPGQPTMVVDDQVGAAGMLAANYVFNVAAPDGLTIGFMASITNDAFVGSPGIKFDITKFHLLGAIPSTQVTLVRSNAKVAVPRDLLHPAVPLIVAGYGGWVDVAGRLFLDMVGAPYRYVTGYGAQAGTVMALRQGEATIADAGAALFLPNEASWRAEGLFVPLAQRGELGEDGKFHRSRSIPNLPTVAEAVEDINPAALATPQFHAYQRVVGANVGQYLLVLPPATPADTVRAVMRAARDTFTDPSAIASAKEKLSLEYNFMDGEEATRFLDRLHRDFESDPEAAAVMRAMNRQ